MAEFCTCGSMIIGGHCSNKNCVSKAAKAAAQASASPKAASAAKKTPKSTKTRRASKCITYNLYDVQDKKEDENAD